MFLKRAMMAALAGVLGAGMAQAQIANQQPAEFPPATFKGKQYVDSTGCVFVRAGIDGNVSWVPRVNRARKIICGFTPSLAGQEQVAAAPAVDAVGSNVEQITLEASDAAAPAARPAPVAVASAAPKPRTVRRSVRKPVRQVAPAQPILVQPTPAPTRVVTHTACPQASPLGQQYLRPNAKLPVRCGPQQGVIGHNRGGAQAGTLTASGARVSDPNTPISVSSHRRIVPRHVAINRINTRNVQIPKGYKPAWEDGRLNPHRAEQTLAGREQMLLVWTNTVPRRLINQTTGRDVTAEEPLVYPYIDIDTQRQELGEVTLMRRNGQLVKRIVRHRTAQQRQPVLSSRSAPKTEGTPKVAARATAPALTPVTGGKRFVQIGYFSTKAKADKAAQYLAGMGMRARIGKVRKGGQTYLAVQAGPFASADATARALNRLRGVGYSGAVARK